MSSFAAATLVLLLQAAGAEALPYHVGPGDVLEVVVDGRPDLSRLPTVQTTGSVWLPRAGEVEVRGLSTGEIAARLTPLLAGEDLASPRVAVRVREYQSQFVWVRGAVQRPGRKPLRSGTRLLDALLDAGGFQEGASGEITVERAAEAFADGSRTVLFRFEGKSPTPRELDELSLPLRAGDVIVAGVQLFVSVSGAVKSPGRRPFVGSLTVLQLVDGAGGILRGASEHVVVRRAGGENEVDLRAIRDSKAQDLLLAPGDEVVVRGRQP